MKMHIMPLLFTCLLLGSAIISSGMDDAQLKDWLVNNFLGYEGLEREDAVNFKKQAAVTDEQFHRVLMDIYHETDGRRAKLASETREWKDTLRIESGVIGLLPMCSDIQVKKFLLDYIESKEKTYARDWAISSYLCVANAEETKNILLRFLVGADRMDDMTRSSIYRYAQTAFKDADASKKAAIFNTLCSTAAVESPQWVFEECDSILIDMYAGYKDSSLRESMLRRQVSFPFSKYHLRIKDQMENEVKRLEKLKKSVGISTNLSALTQYFSQPQPVILENSLSDRAQKSTDAKKESVKRIPLIIVFFTVIAVAALTAVTGLWLYRRKHAV